MENYGFAERLKAARERAGWTQTELGKRSKVHAMAISRLERGEKKDVTGATLRKLAIALQVSGDYLLGLTNTPERVQYSLPPAKRPRPRKTAPVG